MKRSHVIKKEYNLATDVRVLIVILMILISQL